MKSRELGLCLVCGDIAVGINFAVPTCMACKAFFRRNAVKLGRIDFICHEDGNCPVTHKSRRTCNCCRLAKCFRVGMQKSLILSDAERLARKELIQQNRQKRMKLVMTSNSSLIRPSTIYYLTQMRPEFLSSLDQTLLTNIFGAYKRTYAATNNSQYSSFPAIEHSSIHTIFNEYQDRQIALIEYFKLIPEFNRLSIDDKVRLVRNHFGAMYFINEPMLVQCKSHNLVSSVKNSFDSNLATNMLHSIDLMYSYAYDPILLKLILIVRSLSSGNSRYRNDTDMDRMYDDTLSIFAGQNVYVELLWRYLLSRLPSERDAVKFFNKLIIDLLLLQNCCLAVDRYIYNFENEIDKMDLLMQSMYPRSEKVDKMDYDIIDMEPDS